MNVECVIRNPVDRSRSATITLALAASEMGTCVPRPTLEQIGVSKRKRARVGHALIEVSGRQTIDDVAFGEPGDKPRLGERALRGLRLRFEVTSGKLVDAGPGPAAKVDLDAAKFLAEGFARTGCVRVPNAGRRKRENQIYKKSYEIRLHVSDKEELQKVQASLKSVGLSPGKPYAHSRKIVQTVYGKKAVLAFAALVKQSGVKTPKLRALKGTS